MVENVEHLKNYFDKELTTLQRSILTDEGLVSKYKSSIAVLERDILMMEKEIVESHMLQVRTAIILLEGIESLNCLRDFATLACSEQSDVAAAAAQRRNSMNSSAVDTLLPECENFISKYDQRKPAIESSCTECVNANPLVMLQEEHALITQKIAEFQPLPGELQIDGSDVVALTKKVQKAVAAIRTNICDLVIQFPDEGNSPVYQLCSTIDDAYCVLSEYGRNLTDTQLLIFAALTLAERVGDEAEVVRQQLESVVVTLRAVTKYVPGYGMQNWESLLENGDPDLCNRIETALNVVDPDQIRDCTKALLHYLLEVQ